MEPREVERAGELHCEYGASIGAGVRRHACERVIHNRGHGEQVGRHALRLAEQLLRRRKRWRAARSGPLLSHGIRDAKIGNAPSAVAIDQHVLRLEVAVNDPGFVCGEEAVENRVDLWRDLRERPRAGPSHEVGDGALILEFHDVPVHVPLRIPVVDGDNRRVLQSRRHLSLPPESRHGGIAARNRLVQHLQRDLPLQREIAHAPDRPEGARPERAQHFVVVAGGPSQPFLLAHRTILAGCDLDAPEPRRAGTRNLLDGPEQRRH